MGPLATALIVLACVFGGALLGMLLRRALPEQNLSEASKDVVKLVTGLVATLSALVLGLLIASAKNSFDVVNEGFRQGAARIVLLDRALAQYGPEAKEIRETLRQGFGERIESIFVRRDSGQSALDAPQITFAIERMEQRIRALVPQTDAQRALQSRAADLTYELAQARWHGIEHEDNRMPTAFLVVLVFWLAAMFASFGLFAPRNGIAVAALFLGALSLAASMYLIEELNDPLGGVIRVSRTPMDTALRHLGQ